MQTPTRFLSLAALRGESLSAELLECHRQIWKKRVFWNGYADLPRFADGLMLICSPVRAVFRMHDGKTLTAGQGDVVYAPEGARYTVTFENGGGDPDLYTFNFRLRDGSGTPVRLSSDLCRADATVTPDARRIAALLHAEGLSPCASPLRASARFLLLLAALSDTADPSLSEHTAILRGVHALIAEWDRNEPIERYAELSGISASGFYRHFKDWAGRSPNEYRTAMRVSAAKSLLRNSTLTVKEIAAEVGYGDPYYFSRCFRKEVGVSPQAWRRGSS